MKFAWHKPWSHSDAETWGTAYLQGNKQPAALKPIQHERTVLFFPEQLDNEKKDEDMIKYYKNILFQVLLSQLDSAMREVPLILFLRSNASDIYQRYWYGILMSQVQGPTYVASNFRPTAFAPLFLQSSQPRPSFWLVAPAHHCICAPISKQKAQEFQIYPHFHSVI